MQINPYFSHGLTFILHGFVRVYSYNLMLTATYMCRPNKGYGIML
jgi:hypothetical protein